MLQAPYSIFTTCLCASAALFGCAPKQPPRWAEGGATLAVEPARWERAGEDTVQIESNGRVLEGGHLRFVIDRAGRVTDDDYDAFALLLPDGHLVGTDDGALGYVGLNNASPPFGEQAWLGLQPDGRVLFFQPDGERIEQGRWRGCDGPGRRACTLVTQLFAIRSSRVAPSNATFGVGIGVGVGF